MKTCSHHPIPAPLVINHFLFLLRRLDMRGPSRWIGGPNPWTSTCDHPKIGRSPLLPQHLSFLTAILRRVARVWSGSVNWFSYFSQRMSIVVVLWRQSKDPEFGTSLRGSELCASLGKISSVHRSGKSPRQQRSKAFDHTDHQLLPNQQDLGRS